MAIEAKVCTALTGGGADALDFIDGSTLNNGDIAYTKVNGKFYYHRCNTAGGLTEDSPIVIVPDTNPGSINWELAGSNQMITIAKTSDFTVTAAYLQAGVMITNTGAAGAVNLTLPAGAADYSLECFVDAAQYLRCTANGSETFRYGTGTSAAGGYIRANTIGTHWKINWLGGEWVIKLYALTLKYDE